MPHLFRSSLISCMSPLISSGFTSKECGLYSHMMVEGTGGPQNQLQVISSPWSHCSALAHPLASLGCLWGFLSSIHTTVELRGLLGWMSTPPTSMCWNSSSHGDGVRRRALMNGFVPLYIEAGPAWPPVRKRALTKHRVCQCHDLWLPSLRTGRNKYLFFASQPVPGIFVTTAWQTKARTWEDKLALLLCHGVHSVHLDAHCRVQSGQRFLSLKLKASPPQHLISKRKGGDLGVSPSLSHSPSFLQSPDGGRLGPGFPFENCTNGPANPASWNFQEAWLFEIVQSCSPWPGFQNLWLAKPAKQISFKIQASPGKWFLMKVVPFLRGHLGKLWGYFWLS